MQALEQMADSWTTQNRQEAESEREREKESGREEEKEVKNEGEWVSE